MAKAVGVRVPPFAGREFSVTDEKNLSTIKELYITVPEEDIKRKREEVVKYFKNRAKIPGFRPGHAPREIVERIFKEEIKERVATELINEHGKKAISESGLNPLDFYVKDYKYSDDGSFSFSLLVEVIPPYDVVDYKGIEVEIKKKVVNEEDVNNALQSIRENFAQLVPVEDRGVQVGDIVEIEVQRFVVPDKRTLPIERYRWQVEKSIDEIPGLFDNIIGMMVGEEKKFRVNYPSDFSKKNLRGKEVETKVKVVSIKEKKLPEINDEFISQIGEYKSIEELRERIKERLKGEIEKKEKAEIESEILRILREKNPVEVPRTLEKREFERLANSIEISDEMGDEEREKMILALSKIANQNVMNYLILNKIIEKEGIKVEKQEVESELRKRTDISSLSFDEIERLRNEIEKNLLLRRALDFVISKAIIKYKEEN